MKNLHHFLIWVLCVYAPLLLAQNNNNHHAENNFYNPDEIIFGNNTDMLSVSSYQSFISTAVADMNDDGFDDIIRLSESGDELRIEYQMNGAPFQSFVYTFTESEKHWNIAIADVDKNGFNDILVGDFEYGMKLLKANDFGSDYSETTLENSVFWVQGSNFVDINNDGFVDVFVCNDTAQNRIWRNDGFGNFEIEENWIDMSTEPVSDNSGNYSSIWTDFDNDGDLDLYISKCKVGSIDPTDPRRINQLFLNENGQFTEAAELFGLKNGAQSWTTDFQDIDNDGDLDCFTVNHESVCQLFENQDGYYVDITSSSGLNITIDHLQGLLRDFNNDGFVDILVAGNSGYEFYENNHSNTFTQGIGVFGNYMMSTFAVGDVNFDGFLDVYSASSSDNDVLWLNENNNNNNHFFAVNLKGTDSNVNAIGTRLELYGPWGIQVREVRSGESYGIMNSFTQFFGLGGSTNIDSLIVKWPSGLQESFENPLPDQFLTIVENDCAYPGKNIFSNGITKVCPNDSLALFAPAGELFEWSNGATTQQIWVTSPDEYNVTITNSYGCTTISNPISIEQAFPQPPYISVSGETSFCHGGSVWLFSTPADAYIWSNGQETKDILVTQSGDYYVTVPGICGDISSDIVTISVIDNPPIPVISHDTVNTSGSLVNLKAEGDNVKWYYDQNSSEPFWEGESFDTVIQKTVVVYVESEIEIDGVICTSDRIPVWGVVDITPTYQLDKKDQIEIFPNPASEILNLNFKEGTDAEVNFKIIDLYGRQMFSGKIAKNNVPFTELISLRLFPSGIYSLLLDSEDFTFAQKLIIQKD